LAAVVVVGANLRAKAEETVALLVQAGLYDTAVTLAQKFELAQGRIFEALTDRFLRVLRDGPAHLLDRPLAQGQGQGTGVVHTDDEHRLQLQAVWDQLQSFLSRYDSAQTRFEYHQIVANKILSTDPRIKLPHRLVDSFKVLLTSDNMHSFFPPN
jgi:nuclear pore complex protein Nup160